MERVELEVTPREETGKGAMRRLRAEGGVPAVVYGSGSECQHLQVEASALTRVLRDGTNRLINLTGGGKKRLVLIKELQRDPVTRVPLHADFFQVDTKKKIHVLVPIHYEGKSHGVEMGGVLEPIIREIEVECLPLEIPESFALDVSALDIGDALHVSDVSVPTGVVLLIDESVTVIHVIAPRVVEETTEEDEEGVVVEGEEGAPAAEGGEAASATEGAEKATE